jgi:hypothetical protein
LADLKDTHKLIIDMMNSMEADYLSTRERRLHKRRLAIAVELLRREIEQVERGNTGQSTARQRRREEQRRAAERLKVKTAWAAAQALHDPKQRGWGVRAIYNNIFDLF